MLPPGLREGCLGLVLLIGVGGAAGCAVTRPAAQEPAAALASQQLVLADRSYSLQNVPRDASPQRTASFRIAAEGQRAFAQGKYQEAEDRFEKALSLDARNAFCYLYLADIRFQDRDPRQALMLLEQSEVHFHGHPYWLSEVHTRKGICLEELHSLDDAVRSYRKALEYNPWNEAAKTRLERIGRSSG